MIYWEKTVIRDPNQYPMCSCSVCAPRRIKKFDGINIEILLEGFSVNLDHTDFDSNFLNKIKCIGRSLRV